MNEESPKSPGIIGVYGGMGPAATDLLLMQITQHTPAQKDQEHPRRIVIYRPDTPDRTAYLLGKGPDPRPIMFGTLKELVANGATVIGIPCNTTFAVLEGVKEYEGVPIINMVALAVEHIKTTYPAFTHVGILATTGTIQTKLYENILTKNNLKIVIPDTDEQEKVMEAIYHIKQTSRRSHKANSLLQEAAEHIVHKSAEIIIMGCTEIPIGIEDGEASVPLINPSEFLAKALVEAVSNKK